MKGTAYGRRAVRTFGVAALSAMVLAAASLFSLLDTARDLRLTVAAQDATLRAVKAVRSDGGTSLRDAQALFPTAPLTEFQATLQSTLQAVSSRHRFAIESLQTLKQEQPVGLVRQTMRLEGVIAESRLGQLLTGFAEHRPLLLVQDLSLKPAFRSTSRLPSAQSSEPQLSVRLDVSGFAASGGSKTP